MKTHTEWLATGSLQMVGFGRLDCWSIADYLGVSENRGKTPKMEGENHGKPYFLMDDFLGKTHYFWKPPCFGYFCLQIP